MEVTLESEARHIPPEIKICQISKHYQPVDIISLSI